MGARTFCALLNFRRPLCFARPQERRPHRLRKSSGTSPVENGGRKKQGYSFVKVQPSFCPHLGFTRIRQFLLLYFIIKTFGV